MWIAISLAGLLAVWLLLLCVPIELVLRLEAQRGTTLRARVVWLYGLVTREIKPKRKEKAEAKAPARQKRSRRRPSLQTLYRILRIKGLFRQTIRFLKTLLKQFKVKHLKVDMRVGLGDPADTGLLFALIGPVIPFLAADIRKQVVVQPDFGEGVICEGYLQGALSLQPVRLIIPVGRYVFSPPILRLGKTLIGSRWKSGR